MIKIPKSSFLIDPYSFSFTVFTVPFLCPVNLSSNVSLIETILLGYCFQLVIIAIILLSDTIIKFDVYFTS